MRANLSRWLILVVLLVLAVACDGASPEPSGALRLSVVGGDAQHARSALADSLVSPVAARLTRTRGSGIAWNPMDLIAKPLHAQSNVVGVPGEQVCAVPIGSPGLEPWNPCAITDQQGVATFWFEPGTRAGVACAEVRAVVEGAPVVTDTACATIEPGPVDTLTMRDTTLFLGTAAPVQALVFRATDQYGNEVPDPEVAWAELPSGWTADADSVRAGGEEATAVAQATSGQRTTPVRLTGVIDLRTLALGARAKCGFQTAESDSALYALVVDSVVYAQAVGGEIGRFYFAGSAERFRDGAVLDTVPVVGSQKLIGQAPGELVYANTSPAAEGTGYRRLDLTGWDGGNWCQALTGGIHFRDRLAVELRP